MFIDVEVMVILKILLLIFDKNILIKNYLVNDNWNRFVDVYFLKEYVSSYEFNVYILVYVYILVLL